MRLGTTPDGATGGALVVGEDGVLAEVAGLPLTEAIRQGLTPTDLAARARLLAREEVLGERLAPPVLPGKIIAIGLNYRDHVRETGMTAPERPLVFAKFPSSICGSGEPILIDRRQTHRVDWEVELAVVIARRVRFAA